MRSDDVSIRCPKCLAAFRSGCAVCPQHGCELQARRDDPLIGMTIAGRYVLEAQIGEGGMAQVYRARHARLPRLFAVKILYGEVAADRVMRLRFAQEAAAASAFDHASVVSVVDFGTTEEGLRYLVMDYVDGESLSDFLAREAPLEPMRAAALIRRLADGLGHIHACGVVHRDLKPSNVVLERSSRGWVVPRILDFGLALAYETPMAAELRVTEKGRIIGTSPYISPEQIVGCRVDHRTDLYALGVMLCEMLAGVPPFDGTSVEMACSDQPVPSLRRRNPAVSVPLSLETLVRRLLEKDPAKRIQTAQEVVNKLIQIEAPLAWANSQSSRGGTSAAVPAQMRSRLTVTRRSIGATGAICGLVVALWLGAGSTSMRSVWQPDAIAAASLRVDDGLWRAAVNAGVPNVELRAAHERAVPAPREQHSSSPPARGPTEQSAREQSSTPGAQLPAARVSKEQCEVGEAIARFSTLRGVHETRKLGDRYLQFTPPHREALPCNDRRFATATAVFDVEGRDGCKPRRRVPTINQPLSPLNCGE